MVVSWKKMCWKSGQGKPIRSCYKVWLPDPNILNLPESTRRGGKEVEVLKSNIFLKWHFGHVSLLHCPAAAWNVPMRKTLTEICGDQADQRRGHMMHFSRLESCKNDLSPKNRWFIVMDALYMTIVNFKDTQMNLYCCMIPMDPLFPAKSPPKPPTLEIWTTFQKNIKQTV